VDLHLKHLRVHYFFAKQTDKDFTTILHESIAFAGSANFCPVLVGALAGAHFGFKAASMSENDFGHCSQDLRQRVELVASALAETWTNHNFQQ